MTEPAPTPTLEPLKCPECRYDLSGLPTGNCPECGKAFTPEQVREFWKAKKQQPRFRLDLALTIASATYVLLCNCTTMRPGSVPDQYLVVYAGGLAAILLSLPRIRQGTFPLEIAIFHIVPSTLTSLIVIRSSRRIEDSLIVFAAGLLLSSIIVFSFRGTARSLGSRLVYAFALFSNLLIVTHAIVRYFQGNTWTDFNWSSPPQTVSKASDLFIVSSTILGVQLGLIAFLEAGMYFARRLQHVPISSSSSHSSSAAPAPPSQSES